MKTGTIGKKLVLFILGLVVMFGANMFMPNTSKTVFAAENEVKKSGEYLYKVSTVDESIIFMGYTGNATELTIPMEIKGKKVTKIEGMYANKACKYNGPFCDTIKTLTIPATIEMIDSFNMENCKNLEKVILLEGITTIDYAAFSGCENLTEVVLPSTLTTIEYGAFSSCIKLEKVSLPQGLKKIEGHAFSNCKSLSDITIPATTVIEGSNPFKQTKWLENKQAENPLVVINGVLVDGQKATGDIVIPDTVKTIGDTAFWNNENITSVTIPEGVTKICYGAFMWCSKLAKIAIPSSVTSFEESAFVQTAWLKEECAKNEFVIVNNILLGADNAKGDVVVPANVTEIVGAFGFCKADSITVPGTVKKIGEYAFSGCMVRKIVIEEGVEEIGKYAFDEANVRELVIPASVKRIENHAFAGASLNKITFLGVPEFVGDSHFAACEILKTVKFTEGIKTITDGMFYCCKYLNITIPKSVTYIGEKAFYIDADFEYNYGKNIKTVVTVLNKNCEIYDDENTISGTVLGYNNSTATKYAEKFGKTVSLKSAKRNGSDITVSWKKAKKVDGYQLQFSTNKKFKKAKTLTIKKANITSKSISKIKANKKYYVRVRAFKKVKVDNKTKKFYTGWTKAKKA